MLHWSCGRRQDQNIILPKIILVSFMVRSFPTSKEKGEPVGAFHANSSPKQSHKERIHCAADGLFFLKLLP